MAVRVEYVDVQELWDQKERTRRADEEDLRAGRKTEAQLQRENAAFAFPREQIRLRLDLAKSLH